MKTPPAPAWAQLKEGQKPEERGGGRTAAEEGDLRRKHSTCVWKKNIFFEQTRLSASFPRSTIISAQFCFQKERKNITGEGQRGKENSFATGEQTLQGLRGLCRGWQAGGSGQGWGARLPPPTLGPGVWSEPASLISSGDGSTWLSAIPGPTAQAPKAHTGPTVCWVWGDVTPKSSDYKPHRGPCSSLDLAGGGGGA